MFPGEKVEHQPRHGRVGGPRAGVARGAPAGAQLPSEGKLCQPSVEAKTFLETSISPVLASSGCYLGAAGQSSVGLVAVAAMPGKPSAGESPPSGCTTVQLLLSCTAPLYRSVLLHSSYPLPRHPYYTRWPQIENLPSLFSLEKCVGVCRKALLSLATHPIAISTRFNR